jgi:hypothetical protein
VADTNTAHWVITNASPLITLTDSNAAESGNQPSQVVTIVLSGFTNPNYTTCGGTQPNCTFYARILTYSTSSPSYTCNGSTCTLTTTPLDDGGIALSTAQTITITSKVYEQLIFCVYSGASCLAANNGFSLGDTTGVLYTSGAFTDISTHYTITTNAANGVIVRMLGNTLNGTGGTITAIGGTAAQSNTGNDQFGLCTYGTGLTIPTLYNNTGNCNTVTQSSGTNNTESTSITAWYGFDLSAAQSTYGSQIASTTTGGTFTGTIAFIGNVGVTQTAGIYSTTLTFVATGSY